MKRKLLLAAFVAVGALGFNANARENVTEDYMTNAGLTDLTGWTLDGTNNMNQGYYQDWKTDGDVPVIEFYHTWSANAGTAIGSSKTFIFSQTLQLPAGYYRLAVNAFYREGNGTGTNTKAYIYAGDKKQYVVGLTSGGLNSYSGSNDLYKAANAFSNGDFSNEFDFNVTEEDYDDGKSYCSIEVGFNGYIDTYCSWCILGPVTLYEYTADDYKSDYNAKVTVAEGLYSTPMEASVLAALQAAVVDPDGLTTVDEVQAAITALNTAITNANNSIALYESINTAITAITAQSTSGADFAAMTTKYNNGTYTAVSEVYPDYQEIEIAALGTTANTNFTSVIINPGFEFGNTTGWTYTPSVDHGAKSTASDTYKMTNSEGDYLFNIWDKGYAIKQTISGLPNGFYQLTAVTANNGAKVYLLANNAHEGIVSNESAGIGVEGSVQVAITDGNLTIGAAGSNNDDNKSYSETGEWWYKVDNFRLTYLGNTVPTADAEALLATVPSGIMKGSVSEALSNAVSAFESDPTVENYANLETAIANANTSIAAYATAKTAVDKANAIKEANTFVTTDAATTFAEAIAAISDAYDARTLADATAANAEVTLGTSISGWHGNATGAAGVYMESAWDNADNFGDYYINTWSNEGESDGSNFKVPFFEYWVDSGSLAAKKMTGTVVDLTSDQLYKVTADVRVAYSSKVDGSITLSVGDGAAVDVTTGAQVGNTNRYIGTFNAFGKADSDGKLIVTINVADGSGISWLCWQNVTYEETNLDFTYLNSAITAAGNVNAKVTNGVASLAAAIATAQGLLTSATTQDEVDEGVTTLEDATTAAETIIAARLKLAGTVKKATALKAYLADDITEEISAASSYADNAEATEEEATSKTNALNAHFDAWEEVSLTNANFDTNINIAVDGTNSGTASSIDKNTDDKATLYDQTGWTSISKHSSTAAHSASAVYGASSASTKGTNSTNAPAADMYGETEGGVLQISSGWSDQARYEQTIASLPAGKYVFYFEAYNANGNASSINANYFGLGDLTAGDVEGTNNTFKYSDTKSYTSNAWVVDAFGFNTTKDITNAKVKIGVTGTTGGSGSAAKLWIDNLKIYRYVTYESATMAVNASAKYGTFVAPFDVTLPTGVTAYKVSGKATEGGVTTVVTLTEEAAESETLDANTPVVLYAESGLAETKFYGKATGTANENSDGFLTGVYADDTEVAADNYILQLNEGELAFYALESAITGTKNRCYLTLPNAGAKVRVVFADGANAISAIAAENEDVEAIYSVSGTKMNSLQKGINIVKMQNGETKKVFVK